jgi:two-component system, NtrC family, response regulator AtoC
MSDGPDPFQEQGIALMRQAVQILIIEDEDLFARAVKKRLAKAGLHSEIVGTLKEAIAQFQLFEPDLILLDMRLPDGSGLDFLGYLREHKVSEVPVLVLSAYGEVGDAVAAMKLNASDYLKKPIDLDELLVTIDKVLAKETLARQLEYSRKRERHATEGVDLLGEDPEIQRIREQAQHIGSLCATVELVPPTVLILGETGTGKDLVAKLLHRSSVRRDRPFVHMDCAALPRDLIEAELFGHEKGAFTTALSARAGLIEAAEDGVLFLDEIGELSLELQTKLLAVLERRTLRRVGSTQERPVAAWFIAATHRLIEEMVRSGQLRSDLYFRLNVLSLKVPPLRQRPQDIVLLARHFAEQTARRYGLNPPKLSPEAGAALRAYSWPGNARELKHVIERAVLLTGDGPIGASSLMLNTELTAPRLGDELAAWEGLTLEAAERLLIERALARTAYNVSEAARQLGVTRMAIRYRMKKYGLEREL